jgi:hypothetical protein
MGDAPAFRSQDMAALFERARAADVGSWRDMAAAFQAAAARPEETAVPPLRECATLVLRLRAAAMADAAADLERELEAWLAAHPGRLDPQVALLRDAARALAALGEELPKTVRDAVASAAIAGDLAQARPALLERFASHWRDRARLSSLLVKRAPKLARPLLEGRAARVMFWIALGVGAILFGTLVASAVGFARVPPPAVPAPSLGWAVPMTEFPTMARLVMLDADGRKAWIVYGRSACRVVLATGRAERCDALPPSASDPLWPAWHLRARDRLLLGDRVSFDADAMVRVLVLRDDGGPPVEAGWQPPWPVFSLNAAWNEQRGRVELCVARQGVVGDPQPRSRSAAVEPLSLDGALGDVESLPLDLDKLGWWPLAVGCSPPLALSWKYRAPRARLLEGDEVTDVDATSRCKERPYDYPGACVVVQSNTRFDYPSAHSAPAVWLSTSGALVTLPPLPTRADEIVLHIGEQRGKTDGDPDQPVFTWFEAPFSKEEIAMLSGPDLVELRIDESGPDRVLVGRRAGGPWVRIAGDTTHARDWTAIPHPGGVLLLTNGYGGTGYAEQGAVLALDRDLRRADAPGLWAAVGAAMRRHAHQPRLVYFVVLFAFLPLAAAAARRLVRRAPRTRLVVALVVFDLLAAWYLHASWRDLF